MARLQQVVFDCGTPAVSARFRAVALDEFGIRPYGDAEVARLASLGYTPGNAWMRDSEGNDFCLIDGSAEPAA